MRSLPILMGQEPAHLIVIDAYINGSRARLAPTFHLA